MANATAVPTGFAAAAHTFSTSDPVLLAASLPKATQHVAVQARHRNALLLKPLTEIGDHHNLASDRVWRVTLLGYHGGVGVKVFI